MKACALCILMRPDGFALMERRRDFNSWVYPGGRIEDDESPEQAMVRECREEINVRPLRWSALDIIAGVNEWDVYPFVVTEWHGQPPDRTLGKQSALLHWVQPWVVVKNADGPEYTFGAVQAVACALVEFLRDRTVISE